MSQPLLGGTTTGSEISIYHKHLVTEVYPDKHLVTEVYPDTHTPVQLGPRTEWPPNSTNPLLE